MLYLSGPSSDGASEKRKKFNLRMYLRSVRKLTFHSTPFMGLVFLQFGGFDFTTRQSICSNDDMLEKVRNAKRTSHGRVALDRLN